MIDPTQAATQPAPPAEVTLEDPKPPVRVDLACGQSKREGFIGVDISPCEGVDIVHDLTVTPWPFDDESVDEVHCSHFIEHLDGDQQMAFMNELWRVLKVGGKVSLFAPCGWSSRAWQDPTHKRPIVPESFYYYNREWREANKLTHYPITANFGATVNMSIEPEVARRGEDFHAFAMRHYVNVMIDLIVTLEKKP